MPWKEQLKTSLAYMIQHSAIKDFLYQKIIIHNHTCAQINCINNLPREAAKAGHECTGRVHDPQTLSLHSTKDKEN